MFKLFKFVFKLFKIMFKLFKFVFKLCPIYDDTMNTILSQSHPYLPLPGSRAVRYDIYDSYIHNGGRWWERQRWRALPEASVMATAEALVEVKMSLEVSRGLVGATVEPDVRRRWRRRGSGGGDAGMGN